MKRRAFLGLLSATTASALAPTASANSKLRTAALSLAAREKQAEAVRLIVFGDSGKGNTEQYELGRTMAAHHWDRFYDLALMLGDNIYPSGDPDDMVKKFERPYAELLKRGAAGKLDLIALPAYEMLTKLFTQEMRRRNLSWPVAIETSSVSLVLRYVAEGLGVGLCAKSPSLHLPKGTAWIPLTGFPPLPVGAFWKGDLFPAPAAFLEAVEARAEQVRKNLGA